MFCLTLFHSKLPMKIYFAGSIRGGRQDADLYRNIITELQKYGEVLTEHVGSKTLTPQGEEEKTEDYIYRRDIEWLTSADIVIAEVTQPSLGVGYELAFAEKKNIRVVCLFRTTSENHLSAMVRGNKYFEVFDYEDLVSARDILKGIFLNQEE